MIPETTQWLSELIAQWRQMAGSRPQPADFPVGHDMTEMRHWYHTCADELEAILVRAEGVARSREGLDLKVFAEELTEVIWWMLGERDDLPPVPNDFPRRKYWWRHELRQRFEDAQLKAMGALPPAPVPQEPQP